jgi:hypothetical protein
VSDDVEEALAAARVCHGGTHGFLVAQPGDQWRNVEDGHLGGGAQWPVGKEVMTQGRADPVLGASVSRPLLVFQARVPDVGLRAKNIDLHNGPEMKKNPTERFDQ